MNEVPTLRDELDRKTMETLEWLTAAVSNGQITAEQFSTGTDAAFMAVSGLVDEDFVHIFTEAQKQCESVMPMVRHLFHSPNASEIRSATWRVGDDKIVVCQRIMGEVTGGVSKSFSTAKKAQEFLQAFANDRIAKGWIEL